MEDQRDNLGRFVPGVSGNPKGRPKGARTHLSQKFFDDLAQAWDKKGEQILEDMAANDPGSLAKMIASLQPKQLDAQVDAKLAATQVDMCGVSDDFGDGHD